MTSLRGMLRIAFEKSPEPVRNVFSVMIGWIPLEMIYGGAFTATRRILQASENATAEFVEASQLVMLRDLLVFAGTRVPHYRRVFHEVGFDPLSITSVDDIAVLPLLTRQMVRDLGDDLLPDGVPTGDMRYQTTGGTSGNPLGFYITHTASAREWAYMTWQWGRVGFRLGDTRLVIRGRTIAGREHGRMTEWDALNRALYVSSFDLTTTMLSEVMPEIRRRRPRFLHAYPSSATILANHLEEHGERLESIEAVLLGSENILPGQRDYIEGVFGCPTFSWYGHSEKCVLAGECEHSRDYHPFPTYGITELVTEAGEPIRSAGSRGSIVGTGFVNRGTVFIRYLTDDSAEWSDGDCACGRAGRRLHGVTGRWDQEFLVGADGALISITAVNLHTRVYATIRRFRFVQETPGHARVLVVPTAAFDDAARAEFSRELHQRLDGHIAFEIEVVDALPLSASGKYSFIDQLLPVPGEPWAERTEDDRSE